MPEIIKNVLNGITKAQKDYQRWSGGDRLDEAPEYLMTTYIAKELATYKECSYYITLEYNTKKAIADAGGMKPGRPRKDLRPNGKFDILLWWGDGTPRTIIEVKKYKNQYKQRMEEDVSRICAVLEQCNTIRHGIMAYYTAHNEENSRSELQDFLLERMHDFESRTLDYVQNRGMNVQNHRRPVQLAKNWAWVPSVLVISRV